jgi:hypothetical protein
VPRLLVIGALSGAVWGLIAAAVFLAMFRGAIPAPGEAGLPIAIGLVLLYLPFLGAAALETAAGRPSPSFSEIVGLTLASGAGLGMLLIAGIALVRGVTKATRPRS